jgi:N-acyl-D-amino-acid deacylase
MWVRLFIVAFVSWMLGWPASDTLDQFDVLITGARIVDGCGNPWYSGDVGIRNGVIVQVGNLRDHPTARTIRANGMVLAPGFIDMMGESTLPLLLDSVTAQSKLRQGVTTMMAGEGDSLAPQDERTIKDLHLPSGLPHWTTFAEYDHLLDAKGIGINAIHNVGAAQVRRVVIGDEDREPTPKEMDRMKQLVAEAMDDGAVGLSTALIYPPGAYAKTGEIIELAKVAGQHGGMYFSHMRNESGQLLQAIEETIRIGERAQIPVHIYHLKAAGESNWPLMAQALAMIQSARDRGIDVSTDVYPYIRNGLGLGSFIHPSHYAKGTEAFLATLSDPKTRAGLRKEIETTSNWENWYQHVGRNWDNVLVVKVPAGTDKRFEGKSVKEISVMRGDDDWDTFFDLVQKNGVEVDPKSMDENQKNLALQAPFVSIDSDSGPMNPGVSTYAHPRTFGTFPRILAKYVREEKVITLENAIREMTSLPANQLRLLNRGRICPGMSADIVLFDPDKVQDTATFEKPMSYAIGMEYVLVNGKVVIDRGEATGVLAGVLIRANRQPGLPREN